MEKTNDKSSWAMGGFFVLGMGIGFFFFTTSIFWFLACMFIGLGVGLIAAPLIAKIK